VRDAASYADIWCPVDVSLFDQGKLDVAGRIKAFGAWSSRQVAIQIRSPSRSSLGAANRLECSRAMRRWESNAQFLHRPISVCIRRPSH
jgi:hypothetical protein